MIKNDLEEINKIMEDGKQAITLTYKVINIIQEDNINFEALGIFLESMQKSYNEEKGKRNNG